MYIPTKELIITIPLFNQSSVTKLDADDGAFAYSKWMDLVIIEASIRETILSCKENQYLANTMLLV